MRKIKKVKNLLHSSIKSFDDWEKEKGEWASRKRLKGKICEIF